MQRSAAIFIPDSTVAFEKIALAKKAILNSNPERDEILMASLVLTAAQLELPQITI